MHQIRWQRPVDLAPQYQGDDLLIHYSSPLITRQNTVVFAVKTGASDGFRVEAHNAADGSLLWTQASDYTLPPHNWVPSYGIALTPKNRVYFPGRGGTVYFRDNPDAVSGVSGQLSFYGGANYTANKSTFDANVQICTPITADRYGNIYFGFQVTSSTSSPSLESGFARLGADGAGAWIFAADAASDSNVIEVVHNCAPALSNDQKIIYFAVSYGDFSSGYLVALDSRNLISISKVRLKDVYSSTDDALLPDDGTASPTVGPDGDVYFGVYASEASNFNHYRGWLRHFNQTLTQSKPSGAFGWDDTASVVSATLVPSYHGTSSYLLLCKYNNYASGGGDGVNKVAILDPNDTMTDPVTGAVVMKEVITIAGVTPDKEYVDQYPNAVREWCINAAAIDPFTKSALMTSEDGKIYRWDFATNSFSESFTLTSGIGEAYTPTMVGVDGTVYAIANATLFALGQ